MSLSTHFIYLFSNCVGRVLVWYMRCSCRQHTDGPPPYICTACQQMFAIQDVTCHLVRCEPSGRELELVARESMRRLVAERILQLKNLRPPLYLLFAARPWAPVRRPTAVLPERTPLRQPRRLRDASGRGFMDPSSSWRRPGDEGIQRPGPHRTEGRFVLRRCLKDARLF